MAVPKSGGNKPPSGGQGGAAPLRLAQHRSPAAASAAPPKPGQAKMGALSALARTLPRLAQSLARALAPQAKPGAAAPGKAATGGKRLRIMIGPVEKNWEQATAAKGFRELGAPRTPGKTGGQGGGRRAPGFRIMVGRIEKNWEKATAAEGFRELGTARNKAAPGAARARNFKIMVGPLKKNWEEADAAHGFRELGGRKRSSGGARLQLSFVRDQASSGLAAQRHGELSAFDRGAASASRQRANSFAGTERKHAPPEFPDLAAAPTRGAAGANARRARAYSV